MMTMTDDHDDDGDDDHNDDDEFNFNKASTYQSMRIICIKVIY